jgi:glycosyltransferase involved in cell wall biosynthesis
MRRTGQLPQWTAAYPVENVEIQERQLGKHSHVAVIGIRGVPASYGGLETCAEYTTTYWSRGRMSVLVYCRKRHYAERPENLGDVRLKYTPSVRCASLDTLSHTFFSIVDLLVNERHIKLVHLYNTGNAIFLPLLKLFGKKIVMSGDGLEWKREKWGFAARIAHKIGERMAVYFADEIVVDNDEVRKYYLQKYSARTSLIPYGAKLLERDPARSAEVLAKHGLTARRYFIFVGRLVPEKCVHELIEAYNLLETDFPLVIIGDDVNRTAYRDQVFSRQSDRIRCLGFVYGEEYEQLLVNAAVYVSASKLEGTSPSLLAAMGARVCALVNGIEENEATTGGAACMFEKNDFESLRSRWQALVDNPEEAAAFAEKGYRHVVEDYQWDAISERYLDLFSQIK